MKKIIISRGHIWLRDAALQFAKIYRARKSYFGKLDMTRPYWQTEVLEEAVTYLQLSLVNADLTAKYFGLADIEAVGRAFWSKDDADEAIMFGKTKDFDGSERYYFLSIEEFQLFKEIYEIGAESAPEPKNANNSRGPKPKKREKVKMAMRRVPRSFLTSMTEEEMVATFGASRDTCRKARQEVLPEIVDD